MTARGRWWRPGGGFLLNMCLGTLFGTGVFTPALAREFSWTADEISLAQTIALAIFAIAMAPAGLLQDRYGPAVCAIPGALLLSAGFFAASFTTSLVWLYATLGVLVGLGNGLGYAATVPTAAKWIPDRRGLAIGVAVAGYPCAAVFRPITLRLLERFGWRPALQILAALLLVLGLLGAALLRNAPSETATRSSDARTAGREPGVDLRTLLFSSPFLGLWLSYCLGTTGALMVISTVYSFAAQAVPGLSTAAGRRLAIAGAVANAAGRVVSGAASDILRRRAVIVSTLAVCSAACALSATATNPVALFVVGLALYWCYGSLLSLVPAATADAYGTRNLGFIYGLIFVAWGVASVLGPTLGGRVARMAGSYSTAFVVAAMLPLAGAVLLASSGESRR